MEPVRPQFRGYSVACETLLQMARLDATISEEEEDILIYYARELWKAFHTTTTRQKVDTALL